MSKQLCFTADETLIAAIDELRVKIARSRSETIELLLKSALKDSNLVKVFSASGGTGIVMGGTE